MRVFVYNFINSCCHHKFEQFVLSVSSVEAHNESALKMVRDLYVAYWFILDFMCIAKNHKSEQKMFGALFHRLSIILQKNWIRTQWVNVAVYPSHPVQRQCCYCRRCCRHHHHHHCHFGFFRTFQYLLFVFVFLCIVACLVVSVWRKISRLHTKHF